jgi:hypothetical protein
MSSNVKSTWLESTGVFCEDMLRESCRFAEDEAREALRGPADVRSVSDGNGEGGKDVLPEGPVGATPMRPSGT